MQSSVARHTPERGMDDKSKRSVTPDPLPARSGQNEEENILNNSGWYVPSQDVNSEEDEHG